MSKTLLELALDERNRYKPTTPCWREANERVLRIIAEEADWRDDDEQNVADYPDE